MHHTKIYKIAMVFPLQMKTDQHNNYWHETTSVKHISCRHLGDPAKSHVIRWQTESDQQYGPDDLSPHIYLQCKWSTELCKTGFVNGGNYHALQKPWSLVTSDVKHRSLHSIIRTTREATDKPLRYKNLIVVAVKRKNAVLWDMTPHSLVDRNTDSSKTN